MPRTTRRNSARVSKATAETAPFEIREEIVRWDSVKTAHDLHDDMEVASMLLDCYDLVGGHFLVWSDSAKVAPPPLHATLQLQHVSEEGWQTLQEIKALGASKTPKEGKVGKKSRRKPASVTRIWQADDDDIVGDDDDTVDIDFETYGLSEEDYPESNDDDYEPEQDDEDEEYKPLKPLKIYKRKQPSDRRVASQQVIKTEPDELLSDQEDEDIGSEDDGASQPKPAVKTKRGRPRKGEKRPPPVKVEKKEKTKKPKAPKKNWGRYAKVSEVYECTLCPVRGENPGEFRDHFMTHKGEKTESLGGNEEECKVKTESHNGGNGEEHTGRTPSIHFNLERDANILYRCLACNEVLKYKDEHRKLHDRNKRQMVCHLCGKVLNSVDTHKRHLRMHKQKTMGLQNVCKICGKSFQLKSGLRGHMKSHSKERNHICEHCGKGFKNQYHLDRHMLIHAPTKPMTCSYCGRGFNNASNLRGHIRMHTGQKPYKCDICEMAFTHNVSLKSHKKSVHGIDMWKNQKEIGATSLDCDDLAQNKQKPALFPKLEGRYQQKEDSKTLGKHSVSMLNVELTNRLSAKDDDNIQALDSLSSSQDQPSTSRNSVVVQTINKDIPSSSNVAFNSIAETASLHRSVHQPLHLHLQQIQPYPSSALPISHHGAAQEYMDMPLQKGPPFKTLEAGLSQGTQDCETAMGTFTKL